MNTEVLSMRSLPKPVTKAQDLASVLYGLNIGVIPTEQVEGFKKKFLSKIRNTIVVNYLREMVSFVALGTFGVLGAFFIENLAVQIFSGIFAIIGIFMSALGAKFCHESVSSAHWSSQPIRASEARYAVMPSRAKKKVARINKALPEARFEIQRCSYDPFLKVSYDGQSYFIAHWDEPEFEER